MPWSVVRTARVTALAYTISLGVATATLGQTPPGSVFASKSIGQISPETFEAPRPKRIEGAGCVPVGGGRAASPACADLNEGLEGWVELGFMVDARGKPFEVTVIRSTGNKDFDRAAVQAIERTPFEPGSLNGKPIESGYEMKYVFMNSHRASRAQLQFIKAYESLMTAINAGDQAAADAAMKKLRITNLYEDALYGVARYNYATRWGDEAQQLEGLRRAIAEERTARYLPAATFRAILIACLQLELKTNEYAEALDTWKRLKKVGIDRDAAAQFQPLIDAAETLRSAEREFEVSGSLSEEGQWYLHLFKRRFRAVVNSGYISQVKLRCNKDYVYFAFDSRRSYEIPGDSSKCAIELDGAPGTHFKLIQF
jgi:TonB family protein